MGNQIFLEDLYSSTDVDESMEFDKKVFTLETNSIRPIVMYTKPLDDVTFFALNFPFMKYAAFTNYH